MALGARKCQPTNLTKKNSSNLYWLLVQGLHVGCLNKIQDLMNPGFFRRITSASAKIQQKKLRSNSPKEKKKNKSVYWETYFDLSEHIKYEKLYHGCRHFHCYCHGLQASPKTGFSCILSIVDISRCRGETLPMLIQPSKPEIAFPLQVLWFTYIL